MEATKLSTVEIDSQALQQNIKNLMKCLGKNVIFAPVIKSNAYGHGFEQILSILAEQRINTICVAFLEEALIIKQKFPHIRVICLGYIGLNDLETAVRAEVEMVVFNMETIRQISKIGEKTGITGIIHLKLETGTNRQGFLESDIDSVLSLIKSSPRIRIAGLSTHYANIEDTTEHHYARSQLDKFKSLSQHITSRLDHPVTLHTACSAAAILFPKTQFNLVRVGISLYGLWPSKETLLSAQLSGHRIELKPVLTWKTVVSQIKKIPSGSYVGYGCTYKTTTPSTLAYLPIGYYDGFDRHLSNQGWVLIRGNRAPVRGRVCMNVVIVDVTNIPGVELEDEVVLIGSQGQETISAETTASLCGTINYEVVTRINPLIRRVVK
jgi:alanine racemase